MSTNRTCDICSKRVPASYSCPRCNISYCSLACYRDPASHLVCSEAFYQEQVITELKMCRLEEDDSDREKMLEILKKLNKQDESSQILPDSGDEPETETRTPDVADLARAYEGAVAQWTPWWHRLSVEAKEFNGNLARRALGVDVARASPMILDDILVFFYVYSITAFVYQIDDEGFAGEGDLDDELVASLVKIEGALKAQLLSRGRTSLAETLRDSVGVVLGQADHLGLKEHLSQAFLIVAFLKGLFDEVVRACRSALILPRFISNLYTLFEAFLKKPRASASQGTVLEETPLNVFFLNKPRSSEGSKKKQTRGPILGSFLQDAKAMLRRLEFYFKWLNVEWKATAENEDRAGCLVAMKEALVSECEQLDGERKFIGENLDRLRQLQGARASSGVLIEEI